MATNAHRSNRVDKDHPLVLVLLERLPPDSEPRKVLDNFFKWAGDRGFDGITSEDLKGWRNHISNDGADRRAEHVKFRWLFALGYFYDDLKEAGLVRRNPARELIGPLFYGYRGQLPPFTKEEVWRLIEPPRRRAGIRELQDFLICGFSLAFGDRAEQLAEMKVKSIENTTMPSELTRQLRRYLKLYGPSRADKFLFPRISRERRHPRIDRSLPMTAEAIRQAMRRRARVSDVKEQPVRGVKKPSGADRFIATHYLYFRGGRYEGVRPPGVASLGRSLE